MCVRFAERPDRVQAVLAKHSTTSKVHQRQRRSMSPVRKLTVSPQQHLLHGNDYFLDSKVPDMPHSAGDATRWASQLSANAESSDESPSRAATDSLKRLARATASQPQPAIEQESGSFHPTQPRPEALVVRRQHLASRLGVQSSTIAAAVRQPSMFAGTHATEWATALRSCPEVEHASTELVMQLLPQFEYHALPGGTELLEQGATARSMYVLLRGTCRLRVPAQQQRDHQHGRQHSADEGNLATTLGNLSPGAVAAGWIIGGQSFTHQQPASATLAVTRDVPCAALVLSRSMFTQILWKWGFWQLFQMPGLGSLLAKQPPNVQASVAQHCGVLALQPGQVLARHHYSMRVGVLMLNGTAAACQEDGAATSNLGTGSASHAQCQSSSNAFANAAAKSTGHRTLALMRTGHSLGIDALLATGVTKAPAHMVVMGYSHVLLVDVPELKKALEALGVLSAGVCLT